MLAVLFVFLSLTLLKCLVFALCFVVAVLGSDEGFKKSRALEKKKIPAVAFVGFGRFFIYFFGLRK